MNLLVASASRPIASCTAALSDQAPHQSFHVATLAVTSSKSVSATPLATKRGAQCAIADLTSASMEITDLILRRPPKRSEGGPRRMAKSCASALALRDACRRKSDGRLLQGEGLREITP